MSTATSIEWTRGDDASAGATWNPVTKAGGQLLDGRTWDQLPAGRVAEPLR